MSLMKSIMRVDLVCIMIIICDKCLGIVFYVRFYVGIWVFCWIFFFLLVYCLFFYLELCLGGVFFIMFRGYDIFNVLLLIRKWRRFYNLCISVFYFFK